MLRGVAKALELMPLPLPTAGALLLVVPLRNAQLPLSNPVLLLAVPKRNQCPWTQRCSPTGHAGAPR